MLNHFVLVGGTDHMYVFKRLLLQVQHILASTSPGGRFVVWDLRKNEPIIQVADSSSRIQCSAIAWHPDVATQLVTSSGDDRSPVIQVRSESTVITGSVILLSLSSSMLITGLFHFLHLVSNHPSSSFFHQPMFSPSPCFPRPLFAVNLSSIVSFFFL